MIGSDSDHLPDGISSKETLIVSPENRQTKIVLTNSTGTTQWLEAGACLGHASEVVIIPHALLTSELMRMLMVKIMKRKLITLLVS